MASPHNMHSATSPHRRRSGGQNDYPDYPRSRHRSPSSDRERDRKRLRNDRYSPDTVPHNLDRSLDYDRHQDRDHARDRDPYPYDSRRGHQSYPPKRPAVHGAYSNGGGLNGGVAYGRRRPGLISRPYDSLHEGGDAALMDTLNPSNSNGLNAPTSISPHAVATPSGPGASHSVGGYGSRAGLIPSTPAGPYPPAHAKSRRLYIGNVPFQAGLTDYALVQFFSALYVAGFRPNLPGEPLPVVSFWLHGDGKFGFMELRGEQETVNMMQFNQTMLHGRLLKVNRPSDYRPEIHNPNGGLIQPEEVNAEAVLLLCEKLDGLAAPPPLLVSRAQAIRAAQENEQYENGLDPAIGNGGAAGVAPTTTLETDVGASSMGVAQSGHSQIDPNLVNDVVTKREDDLVAETGVISDGVPPNKSFDMEVDQLKGASSHDKIQQSVVISLQNLVTDEDLDGSDEEYGEIVEDVESECGKYGKVVSVNIPRTGHWKRTAFVQFADEVGAKEAIEALAKRVFDGRKIVAVGVEGVSTAEEAANRSG